MSDDWDDELVKKLVHHKWRGQFMDDEEEVDYKE